MVCLRSERGLRVTNIRALLVPPPPGPPLPVETRTRSMDGSSLTALPNFSTKSTIAWNEVPWSATMFPTNRPVSCCGKNPLATLT